MPINSTVLPLDVTQIHPNYLVSISGTNELGKPIGNFNGVQYAGRHSGIIAILPEEFVLNTASTWKSLLNGMLDNAIGNAVSGLASAATAVTGVTLVGSLFSQLVWDATTPIEFRLPLMFNAVHDAQKEVMLPVMQLLSMTLPSRMEGTVLGVDLANSGAAPLYAPGPTLGTGSQYNVTITIGQAFMFSKVIITGVSATFKTLPTESGSFISADVELSVSTSRILTKNDLAAYFLNGGVRGAIG